MAESFFEKLKKGMGIDGSMKENLDNENEAPAEKTKIKRARKNTKSQKKVALTTEPKIKIEEAIKDDDPMRQEPEAKKTEEEKGWFAKKEGKEIMRLDEEGQLPIDVYQTDDEVIVRSAIAGVKPEELDISIEKDSVTIKGERKQEIEKEGKGYLYQECYWGSFSREFSLPVEVDASHAEASMREGILTIRIPKIDRETRRKIVVKK